MLPFQVKTHKVRRYYKEIRVHHQGSVWTKLDIRGFKRIFFGLFPLNVTFRRASSVRNLCFAYIINQIAQIVKLSNNLFVTSCLSNIRNLVSLAHRYAVCVHRAAPVYKTHFQYQEVYRISCSF